VPQTVSTLCSIDSTSVLVRRFDASKIEAWLRCKVERAAAALAATCPQSLPPGADGAMRYAAGLVCDYLSAEWAARLLERLGAAPDLPAAAAGHAGLEPVPVAKRASQSLDADENKRPKVCARAASA
jgi:hypothetical protein